MDGRDEPGHDSIGSPPLQTLHERLQPRRPQMRVEPRRRMPEFAVEQEIIRIDAGGLQSLHHARRDLGRKQLVGPREYEKHLGFDLAELLRHVEPAQRLGQNDQRVGVETLRPSRRLVADRGFDLDRIGQRRFQAVLDAVGLQRRHADLRHGIGDAAAVVIVAAVPVRIPRQAGKQAKDVALGSLARHQRRGEDGRDAAHHVGVVDRPLERLEAAIGGTHDRDQFRNSELVDQEPLRADNVADRDIRKAPPVGRAGRRIDASAIGRAVGRSQHVRADRKPAVGVDRLAGAHDLVPASLAGRTTGIDHLRARGVAMCDEHGIAAIGRQRTQRAVSDRHFGHDDAAPQPEIAGGECLQSEVGHALAPFYCKRQHCTQRMITASQAPSAATKVLTRRERTVTAAMSTVTDNVSSCRRLRRRRTRHACRCRTRTGMRLTAFLPKRSPGARRASRWRWRPLPPDPIAAAPTAGRRAGRSAGSARCLLQVGSPARGPRLSRPGDWQVPCAVLPHRRPRARSVSDPSPGNVRSAAAAEWCRDRSAARRTFGRTPRRWRPRRPRAYPPTAPAPCRRRPHIPRPRISPASTAAAGLVPSALYCRGRRSRASC